MSREQKGIEIIARMTGRTWLISNKALQTPIHPVLAFTHHAVNLPKTILNVS